MYGVAVVDQVLTNDTYKGLITSAASYILSTSGYTVRYVDDGALADRRTP